MKVRIYKSGDIVWRCLFRHLWQTHQHHFDSSGGTVVIAWRQCSRCAKSKLIHILQ